jgi:hypothetical protein
VLLHSFHEAIAGHRVTGRATDPCAGHYKALLWKEEAKEWATDDNMGIHVSVEVGHRTLTSDSSCSPIHPPSPEYPSPRTDTNTWMPFFVPPPSRHSRPCPCPRPRPLTSQELATGHTVVNTRGPPEGRFTFTSHDPGDHNICLHSNITGGWLNNEHIKMYLDVNVGSSKHDTE